MKNLKVRMKLTVLLLMLIVGTTATTVIGAYGMQRINAGESELAQVAEAIVYSGQLDSLVLELRVYLREMILRVDDPAETERLIEYMHSVEQRFADVHRIMYQSDIVYTDQASMELLAEIEQMFDALTLERQEFYSYARNGDGDAMLRWHTDNTSRHTKIQALCDDLNMLGVEYSHQLDAQDTHRGNVLLGASVAVLLAVIVLFIILGGYISNMMVVPLQEMATAAERLAVGDLDIRVTWQSDDEVGMLSRAFLGMVEAIREQVQVTAKVSQGDYSENIAARSPQDVMNLALNEMVETTNDRMSSISSAANQVSIGSQQISNSAQSLAAGSSEQSANVEQFSAALGEVLEEARDNAGRAGEALQETSEMSGLIEGNIAAMRRMQEAMTNIDASARDMAKVIKAIEDIAFQTNILALNAAIEAARAGQYGKGFAVVADEVRSLAAKSSVAAKETTSLIASSIAQVQTGNEVVAEIDTSLDRIDGYSLHMVELMKSISGGSERQVSSIGEINQGITQISKVIQENSSTAQQTAAAAEEMASQAEVLRGLLVGLKLKGHGTGWTSAHKTEAPDGSTAFSLQM